MYWAKCINKCPPVSYKDDKEQGDEVCQRSFQNCETNNSLRWEDGQAQCLEGSEHFYLNGFQTGKFQPEKRDCDKKEDAADGEKGHQPVSRSRKAADK